MKLGRLPLPRDERDFPMARILPERQLRTFRYWRRPIVLDQGDTSTCEGNAWTAWLADAPVVHPDIDALNDPVTAEVYAVELYEEATGDSTLLKGGYTRQFLKVLQRRGLIGNYYRAASVDEVITCILTTGPVCFGSYWYSSMDRVWTEYGNAYLRVDEGTTIRGGGAGMTRPGRGTVMLTFTSAML